MTISRRNMIVGTGAVLAVSVIPAIPALAAPAIVSEPKRKLFHMPSIHWIGKQSKILDMTENSQTILYHVMERWEDVKGQSYPRIEMAPIWSDRYKEWLVENPPEDGIPYHITNGYAIKGVPGGRDPVLYKEWWENRTRERLANGFFDRDWSDITILYPGTGLAA